MKLFDFHSIILKTVLFYLLLTVLTITLFVAAVYRFQYDQITENAILNSQNTAAKLKLRIDRIAGHNDMSPEVINRIIKETVMLGGGTMTLYGDKGQVFVHIVNNRIATKTSASSQELLIINRVTANQGFDEKVFYQEADLKQKSVSLFIPFVYGNTNNGVAAVVFALHDIDERRVFLYHQCLMAGVAVIILMAIFAFLLCKLFLFPLRQLSVAARSVAAGQFDVRVPIVRNDELGSLASAFNELSVTIQRMLGDAKGTSPVTGLPGHITIFNYLNECIVNGRIICALYCDLSNFRAYNNKYGFAKGDEVIVYMRDCMRLAAKKNNISNVFIGHEGGDEFVAITEYEQWEPFAKSLVSIFDKGLHLFYNSTDARNGYIESINRKGESRRFPLMCISIAVVTNKTRDFKSVAEIISVAGEVKKYIKSREGSCYAIDRRTGAARPPSASSEDQTPPV